MYKFIKPQHRALAGSGAGGDEHTRPAAHRAPGIGAQLKASAGMRRSIDPRITLRFIRATRFDPTPILCMTWTDPHEVELLFGLKKSQYFDS